MRRILTAYKNLMGILYKESPMIVIITVLCTLTNGLITPLGIYIKQNVFDGGIAVANGEMPFSEYYIFLILFVISALLPEVITCVIFGFIQPRSMLILRTAYKERMLQKLKTVKYEHFENEDSVEIIDKAFNRTENAVMHLWPMYFYWRLGALISSIGTFCYAFSIRWWLVLTILIPFLAELYISTKKNFDIYKELETYWKKERKYGVLGDYLKQRNFLKEMKAYGNSGHMIEVYKKRLNERNRDYEHYYFKNIRSILFGNNITKIGTIINVIILLTLFMRQQISIGLFITISTLMFSDVYSKLESFAGLFKWAGMHINTFEYYDKFFSLSDQDEGKFRSNADWPDKFDIEFRHVWFRYPGTEKDILKDLSFKIRQGEKVSIVGENGEGKSTIVKLLLGLFTPDRGEILLGGRRIDDYPREMRSKFFGSVFQDFQKYCITIQENIGIGDIEEINNTEKIRDAARKGKADEFIEEFEKGYDTLLGRNFEGAIDISGGQWQRIVISRAFMGDKPIILLDEPTSQLDPMAETDLYKEFADMVENNTAILITHRLGATMITDRIMVINDGAIQEIGTHEELMKTDGLYSKMFNSQKQWYEFGNRTS